MTNRASGYRVITADTTGRRLNRSFADIADAENRARDAANAGATVAYVERRDTKERVFDALADA